MNKIFKIIFSKARGCYVVVSELAKSSGSGTPAPKIRREYGRTLTAAVMAALMGMAFVGAADITTVHDYSVNSVKTDTDTNYSNGGAQGSNALAAGVSAKVLEPVLLQLAVALKLVKIILWLLVMALRQATRGLSHSAIKLLQLESELWSLASTILRKARTRWLLVAAIMMKIREIKPSAQRRLLLANVHRHCLKDPLPLATVHRLAI